MREKDYLQFQEKTANYFRGGIKDLLDKSYYGGQEEDLDEIDMRLWNVKEVGGTWSIEKLKIMLSVLKLQNDSTEIEDLLSYFNQTKYGWQGENYLLRNGCLNGSSHCRFNWCIDNSPEATSEAFENIEEIFLHEKYGAITTYLFGYCLAALFSSRLKNQRRGAPYFLQVACKWNSNTYRLVHEIVHICDINTGIFAKCRKGTNYINHYRECNNNHMILCPSGSVEKALDGLIYYRDIPVIVDGYEETKLYEGLLREVANIPNKFKELDIKAKFNVLPVFICPAIRSHFQNIFNMDLVNLEIEDEYLDLIIKNEQRLASWTLEFVKSTKDYFNIENSSEYSSKTEVQKLIELRNRKSEAPLFYDLDDYINGLLTNSGYRAQITHTDRNNAGYLLYFFSHYMKVFERSIRLSVGKKFLYKGENKEHQRSELIGKMNDKVKESILALHQRFAPTRPERFNIEIDSDEDNVKTRRIREYGEKYAKEIIKYYKSYGVPIILLPDIQYRKERYVFFAKLVPGAEVKLISRYAEEVRRMLELEFFRVDITSNEIRIIASEKPLNENSLVDILDSDLFKKSKMELPYAVGYDMLGGMVIADIAEFPHLLIGGTSGSGKSSALHSLLMSIVYKQPADKVKLLLMDFGASRLKMFRGVPHMLTPGKIISDIKEGRQFMLKLQETMEQRLKILDTLDVRDYDKQIKKWPSIICVIDEFSAFIKQLTEGRGNKNTIAIIEDVLARARKVKIHLILAATDTTKGGMEITNTNLAAGIAFRCKNWHTSKTIIDDTDAVNLSGKGSMYFKCDQGLRRLQAAFMPPEEIMDRLDELRFVNNHSEVQYDEMCFEIDSFQKSNNHEIQIAAANADEQILVEIIEWIQNEGKEKISNKQLKDNFEMGYDRANVFLERLEGTGIISEQKKGAKLPRVVYSDKAKKFLRDHGYVEDISKGKWVKPVETYSMQNDMELKQDRGIKTNDEETNIKDCSNDSIRTKSGMKTNRKSKIDLKCVKKCSIRNTYKKKPSR